MALYVRLPYVCWFKSKPVLKGEELYIEMHFELQQQHVLYYEWKCAIMNKQILNLNSILEIQ